MLCSQCRKNPASLVAKAILDNWIREISLCGSCAADQGFSIEPGTAPFAKVSIPSIRRTLRCPSCALAYRDFKASGLLGCADCYQAFRKPLEELVTRIHGACSHEGKGYRPTENPKRLRQEIAALVEAERYEEAVRLRDRLEEMEGRD